MSRIPNEDDREKRKMVASYANDIPVGQSQTLPSFRELLPPYLHEEIDSASYFHQSRQGRPGQDSSGQQGSSSPSRSTSSGLPRAHSSRSLGNDRQPSESSPSSRGSSGYHRGHGTVHSSTSESSLPAQRSRPASQLHAQGPSPLLPPIRDLHSLSDRNLNRVGTNPEDSFASRSGSYISSPNYPPLRESGYPGPGPAREEQRTAYVDTTNAHHSLYNQSSPYETSRYGSGGAHYPGPQSNDPNYAASVQTSQSPNFGMIGDPMDSRSRRRRGNLPKPVTDILRAWFHEHLDHPYPSEEDKQIFMSRTGLSISQISNWFINARRRQLPALRNQIRNSEGERGRRSGSPMSDGDPSSPASGSSPIH